MLTSDDIEDAKSGGRLFAVSAIAPWVASPRAFLMCRPLYEELEAGKALVEEKTRQRWATLEAAMAHFVENGRFTENLLKPLSPHKYEHWELRSRSPKPSLRVFGRFRLPNVFIGTHVMLRKKLGGKWSSEFEHEKLVCEEIWNNAKLADPFSDAPLFRYDHYITENASTTIKLDR